MMWARVLHINCVPAKLNVCTATAGQDLLVSDPHTFLLVLLLVIPSNPCGSSLP